MSGKKIQLFGRLGNKTNDIKFFKDWLVQDVNKVIEPFGGSFSVIRCCYSNDKYEKIVSDTDEGLYTLYSNFDEYYKYLININKFVNQQKLIKPCINYKELVNIPEFEEYKNNNFFEQWYKQNIVRGSLVKSPKSTNCDEFIDIMRNIKFYNDDYLTTINKYKNDENAFIFLDPPYLFSDNSSYSNQTGKHDMTQILVDIINIFEDADTKAKIMLIINDLAVLRHLFKKYIKGDYARIYQLSKKTQSHLIITNYDIPEKEYFY